MPMFSTRLLDETTVQEGDALDPSNTLDLGEYSTLGVAVTVHEAGVGTAPLLVLEHAAANKAEQFGDFETPITVPLDSTGTTFFQIPAFLRYVRWTQRGSLSSPAVASLNLIAKT